jgi:hypothetical protein
MLEQQKLLLSGEETSSQIARLVTRLLIPAATLSIFEAEVDVIDFLKLDKRESKSIMFIPSEELRAELYDIILFYIHLRNTMYLLHGGIGVSANAPVHIGCILHSPTRYVQHAPL